MEKLIANYSIDKVKLEFFYIKTPRIQDFLNCLGMAEFNLHYESNAITKCKHNFLWGKEGNGSVYVGIIPNWESEQKSDKNIILEYNPNKVNPFEIKELAWLKNIPKTLIKVMNFDVAVDMPVPYSTVRMGKRDIREQQCWIGHGDWETRYLGADGHGHIKLYDKAKEQKIKDFDWTRFEITCKKINSFSPTLKEFEENISLPPMYFVCAQINILEFEQLNDTTRIVLESIIADMNVLYTIKNYRTRKKFEALLCQYMNSVDISKIEMYKAFNEFSKNFLEENSNLHEIINVYALMRNLQ